jgi:hypothetical protein
MLGVSSAGEKLCAGNTIKIVWRYRVAWVFVNVASLFGMTGDPKVTELKRTL